MNEQRRSSTEAGHPSTPTREPVKQRGRSDCGVAVLAWLTGVTWEEARHAIFGERDTAKRSYRTGREDVVRGLAALGYSATPVSRTRHWKNFSVGRGFAAVFVTVPAPIGAKRCRHWVAWERAHPMASVRLMDPADGTYLRAELAAKVARMTLRSHFRIEGKDG